MTAVPLTELGVIAEAWDRVFISRNPGAEDPHTLAFRYPFTRRIEAAAVCFPLDGYYLERRHLQALTAAMRRVGSTSYFVSTYEDEPDFLNSLRVDMADTSPRHFHLTADDTYEQYRSAVPMPWEYAAYSARGDWGVIVSQWLHAIVGGSREFIAEFKQQLGTWQRDVAALKYFWDEEPNHAWLDELFLHLPDCAAIAPAPLPTE